MNPDERIRKTINHEEADRVPYDLGGTTTTAITRQAYERAMRFRGFPPETKPMEIDPIQQIVIPSEKILARLNVDTRRIGAQRIPGFRWREEPPGSLRRVTDLYGCHWDYTFGKDLYFNQASFPLEGFGTLAEGIRELPQIKWEEFGASLHDVLDKQIRDTGSYYILADRNTAGLTENSLRVRGYEKWYLDTVLEPASVEDLLERMAEDKIRYWDLLIDWAEMNGTAHRIGAIAESDDLGTQDATIIDPGQIRSIVIPRWKRIFSHIKNRLPGVKIFLHSCGAIRELIPDLVDAGVDLLNPVQFTAAGMQLEGLKRDFGDLLTFWGGGVDTQNTLNKGTPQEVRDEVKKILDIMAPGGGFVFTPVHNIQHDVSPENFWAMWDTLQEYGKY